MTGGPSSDDDPDMIERLDVGDPPRSPEEAEARAPYERLLDRIRDLEDIAPPAGWEDRARTRWSAAKRKRRLGIAFGVGLSVALVALIWLQPCAPTREESLELAVVSPSGVTRRGDAAVGDVLHARAPVGLPYMELRIYIGTARIARCPGNPECRRDAATMEIAWKLADVGMYEVVVLSSSAAIPAGDGTRDRDLLDAQVAGVHIEARSLRVSL